LVDDEPEILRILVQELEDLAEVTACHSVTDALALLSSHTYDIVVSDLRLPDRWGDELFAHVAARAPKTRRLLLTGDTDPQRTVRELLEKGVIEACFRKPFTHELIATIRAHGKESL
jgi:DNA-binding NtrC family response regulator